MRKLSYVFAIAAGPLAGGLAGAESMAAVGGNLVQKVHSWHCRKRYGWYRGHKRWHRHSRACYESYDYYDDYYPYPFVYGGPFFSFYFDDDDHHRRRHHRRHYRKRKHY
jgi:hypothetical protein